MIVNGDILTEDDAAEALRQSGADGVMIGRGCYGRPWFPALVACFLRRASARPSRRLPSRRPSCWSTTTPCCGTSGEDAGVRVARKHVSWYSRGLFGSAEFRSAVNKLPSSRAAVEALIDAFFDPLIDRNAARAPEALAA